MSDRYDFPISPESDFDAALARFSRLAEKDGEHIDARCGSMLLHHGRRTERALVLYHGFTNCPAQLRTLAQAAYLSGCNVLAPRAPGHGRADGSPLHLTALTPEEFAAAASEAVDIASGLGENVEVAGFSFGGVQAAWVARNRDPVRRVTMIAPAFAPYGLSSMAPRLLPAICAALPERYLWWDPIRREDARIAPYGYRRLSRRGIGAVFALGADVRFGPARRADRLENAVLVINESDIAISPRAARAAFSAGIAPLAERAEEHRIPAALGFPHDLIDPEGINAEKEPEARRRLCGSLGVWPRPESLTSRHARGPDRARIREGVARTGIVGRM